MYLPDINVWLALTFEAHYHHLPATEWCSTLDDDSCCFCRLTQMGFLRLASNRSVFRDQTLTLDQAWACYELLLSDERVFFAEEPLEVETFWRDYTRSQQFSPKVWNDAYLAAFARSNGYTLVSFDKGVKQYNDAAILVL